MKIDITGALFTLRFQYENTQTQRKEGTSDVNYHELPFTREFTLFMLEASTNHTRNLL